MQAAELPEVFGRYVSAGGVLEFHAVETEDMSPFAQCAAIAEAFPGFDTGLLARLGGRRVTPEAFLGDWAEPGTGRLIQRGDWILSDGRKLTDPRVASLEGLKVESGACPIPEVGSGGQFAYAFSRPPYGMTASPAQVQALFDGVWRFLSPPGVAAEITDWSSPDLPQVSDYFRQGAEWWGVFLFVVAVPAIRRMTLIAGSTTD